MCRLVGYTIQLDTLFRQMSVNVEDEKSRVAVSLPCQSVVVSPLPQKTYQHPHDVRPQLGKTVGRSSAVCLGLIGGRTGSLVTFHDVKIFCLQSQQSGAKIESKPAGRGLITAVNEKSVTRLLLEKVAPGAPVKCSKIA